MNSGMEGSTRTGDDGEKRRGGKPSHYMYIASCPSILAKLVEHVTKFSLQILNAVRHNPHYQKL